MNLHVVNPGAKVPSVLYYDYQNIVKLCGAEAEDMVCLQPFEASLRLRCKY